MVGSKRFQIEKKCDPMSSVRQDMDNLWGSKDEQKLVRWILNLRVGNVQS